jgi:hypothetical protein
MNLHFPDLDPRPQANGCADCRRPVAAWMLILIIASVLAAALVASSLEPDTRTFAERHLTVPTGARAL